MTRTSHAAIGAGKNRDGYESSDESNVEQDPKPAKPSRTTTLEQQRDQHSDERVQNSGCQDAFNSAIGTVDATTCLDGIDEIVDLAKTG